MLISYGLGSAAPTLAQEFCGAFLLLFYTELAGLDPVWVGTALLFRMLLDALIDPLVGSHNQCRRTTTAMDYFRQPARLDVSGDSVRRAEWRAMVSYRLSDHRIDSDGDLLFVRVDTPHGHGI